MNYDRIILELIDRVSALEDEVEILKNKSLNASIEENDEHEDMGTMDSSGRDTTKYILDGKKYGKNRLVLAIIKKYMEEHPDTSADELISIFDRSLQGSLGVIRKLREVKKAYADYERRFFTNEIINTSTDVCVVCNQWGISNIGYMITRAKELNIKVTAVK